MIRYRDLEQLDEILRRLEAKRRSPCHRCRIAHAWRIASA